MSVRHLTPCEICSAKFWPESRIHKYCSPPCQKTARLRYSRVFGKHLRQARIDQELCVSCGLVSPDAGTRCRSCAGDQNESNLRRRRKMRMEVITAYGGQCACCGETRWEFLVIDHIYGGGNKERKANKCSSFEFYRQLKAAGFPNDKFRLLCHNCNQTRGHLGYCPHDREREIAQPVSELKFIVNAFEQIA